VHCTKISAEFTFGGHSPLPGVRTDKNVAFSYDVGIIIAGWQVIMSLQLVLLLLSEITVLTVTASTTLVIM